MLGSTIGDGTVAGPDSNLADLLHAAGREEEGLAHLREAARLFSSVASTFSPAAGAREGANGAASPRPQIWALVEW